MREGLTIYDLPTLDSTLALESIADTVKAHLWMSEVYDPQFIKDLVRRKGAYNNFLLLLLAQPDDYRAKAIWNQVDADLQTLKVKSVLAVFKRKMRRIEKASFDSWYTELLLAAWLSRQGLVINLEPAVGSSVADFRVKTEPETWWEIKSLQNSKNILANDIVLDEIQRRLNKIPEPYSLSLISCDFQGKSVSSAIKSICMQLAAHFAKSGPTPAIFKDSGIVIEANATSRKEGYLALILGVEYSFSDEKTDQVEKALQGARSQLPADKAGIIVVDSTQAHFIKADDIEEACYGKTKLAFRNFQPVTLRAPGYFRPTSNTRVSAVIWYTRSFIEIEQNFDMLIIHNPFAKVKLSDHFLPEKGIRQKRLTLTNSGELVIEDFVS